MQVRRAIFAVLFTATFMAAQNAAQIAIAAAPAKHAKASSVRESILNSNQARMSWEASQTWSIPAPPHANSSEPHSVHIDEANQPTPALPKLRREWLAPADESPRMVSEK